MLPKKAKNNINIKPPKQMSERVEELLEKYDQKSNFGVEGIKIDDLDGAVLAHFRENLPDLDGKPLPVFFLATDRWADFKTTWKIRDNDKNILPPYAALKRNDIVKGTRMGEIYKVPQGMKFQYIKVLTLDDDKSVAGFDVYKMPQPTNIDCKYDLIVISKYIRDINAVDSYMFKFFSSLQGYIQIRGNFMPIYLESPSEDNEMGLETEKLYKRTYSMTLKGFIIDPNDSEVIKSPKRIRYTTDGEI